MGKHAADDNFRERRRSRLLLITLLVLGIAGGAVIAVTTRGGDDAHTVDAACANGSVPLVLAVDPSETSWVRDLVRRYVRGHPTVGGRCVRPQVESMTVGDAGTVLRSTPFPGGGTPPDVWMPDSTVAFDSLRAQPDNAAVLPDRAAPIASSPLVLAAPRSAADALRSALGGTPSVAGFLAYAKKPAGIDLAGAPLRLAIADPIRSSAGLATVLAAAAAGTGGLISTLTPASFSSPATRLRLLQLQSMISTVQPSASALMGLARAANSASTLLQKTGVLVVPERDVIRYDATNPTVPLDPVYAFNGTLALDYPYAVVHAAWVTARKQQAAADFSTWLASPGGRSDLGEYGLRRADGSVGGLSRSGIETDAMRPTGLDTTGAAATARSAWTLLTTRRSVLALIDVSGSMGAHVPGTTSTRLDLSRAAATGSLPYFSAQDEIGLWEFSTELAGSKDYRELVPLGSTDGSYQGRSRRDAAIAAYQSMTPQHGTALYDSILAAYKNARNNYVLGALNAVVVLTDGKDEDDPNSVGLSGLLRVLGKLQDPEQPLRIVTIGYGTGTDASVLDQIAKATGGLSFNAPDPRSIGTVFITALAALAD